MRETNGPVTITFTGANGSGKSALSHFIRDLLAQSNIAAGMESINGDTLVIDLRPDQLAALHEKPRREILRVDSAEVRHAIEHGAATIDRLRRSNEVLGGQVDVLNLVGALLRSHPGGVVSGAEIDAAWRLRQLLADVRPKHHPADDAIIAEAAGARP